MATLKQQVGEFGEDRVIRDCLCPRCKRSASLKRLPNNFKCADVICDFCGFLGQVKASTALDVNLVPDKVLGAAWGPQKERMDAAIYFPLFLVLKAKNGVAYSIFYLSADLQVPAMFVPRKPLSEHARRAGWQGFLYDISSLKSRFVRLV